MTYPVLKAKGHKFYEIDHYDGGIYLYTDEYWVCNGQFFIHSEHPNANRYTGRTCTDCMGDIKEAYDNCFYNLSADRDQICEAYDKMVAELEAQNTPPSSLKELRLAAELTQQQLAHFAGMSVSQIQKIEAGTAKMENITLKNAVALAKVLGVAPQDFLGSSPD
jgi:DNA-binding XRE family transcriptional regulator